MPQIAQIAATYASQIFWMLVVFGLIYFGIGRSMLPRIEATMDGRAARVADDLAAAQAARRTADETEEAYRTRMGEARAAAQRAAQEAKASAAAESEAKVKAADAVSAERMTTAQAGLKAQAIAAMAAIEDVAAEAAQDIVTRLSGAAVSRERAAAAVKTALGRS